MMKKIKPGFELMDVCGDKVIVAHGLNNVDFNTLIQLNESAAFLWEKVSDGTSFDQRSLAELLLSEYDGVTLEEAEKDTAQLIAKWEELQIITNA